MWLYFSSCLGSHTWSSRWQLSPYLTFIVFLLCTRHCFKHATIINIWTSYRVSCFGVPLHRWETEPDRAVGQHQRLMERCPICIPGVWSSSSRSLTLRSLPPSVTSPARPHSAFLLVVSGMVNGKNLWTAVIGLLTENMLDKRTHMTRSWDEVP